MDFETWEDQVAGRLRRFAGRARIEVECSGPYLLYGSLAGMALWPIAEAVQGGNLAALGALYSLGAGAGINLIANQVQSWKDEADAAEKLAGAAAEDVDVQAVLDAILARLEALPTLQAAMSDDDRDWFAGLLRDELERAGSSLVVVQASGGSAAGTKRGIAQVGVGHIALSGDVQGDVTIVQKKPEGVDAADLRRAYLCRLQGECGRLSLRGMDVDAGDPTRAVQPLNLANVYIELDTTVQVPAGAGPGNVIFASLQHSLAQDGGEQPRLGSSEREKMRRVSALECAARFRHMVLLGDPGGGKSTFVNHLALCLVSAQLEGSEAWQARYPAWPDDAWGLVPVPVTLRDLGQRLPRDGVSGTAKLLWTHMENWLADRDLAEFAPYLKKALHQGEVLVLLDGLDEVPIARQRTLVRDVVADFAATYREVRILVTCRTLSYQDERGKLPDDFAVFELAPFDERKIDTFVDAWYGELETMGTIHPGEAEPLARRLREAMRRPDLWRLAPNPLLLTVMALVHTHKGRLPEARALLYEECVEMLLWRWEQRKLRAGREEGAKLRSLLLDAGLQTVDLKRILWRLAYQVHTQDRGGDDSPADLREDTLLRALRDLHPDRSWDWAQAVVNQVRERAGLLVERQPGVYTFPHRTFQEYLAGCHLSVERQFGHQGARLAREDDRWREAILLAVGRLVHHQGETDRPLALAAELCPVAEPTDDGGWRAAWLAGEVLLEAGVERASRLALGKELLARVRQRLATLVSEGLLAPRERAEAGSILGKLGDPRPGVGSIVGAVHGSRLPDILWVEVPAGSFVMGNHEDDQEANDDEKPQQCLEVPHRYWMARYPTTVAQYGCFMDDGGYEEPHWWTQSGWAWRQGEWDSQVDSKGLRDWLQRRPAGLRGVPMWWKEQKGRPNWPVVGASWFEAVAFCCWLTERIKNEVGRMRIWRGDQVESLDLQPPISDIRIRLPTEAEWEKAARGDDGRRYPWGNEDWDSERANIYDSRMNHATPGGIYPRGATPSGLLDMAGNVLEWTAGLYRSYPYHPDDGRNDPEAAGRRVLRGGSWGNFQGDARCAYRNWIIPDYFSLDVGIRVVVSLASSEF